MGPAKPFVDVLGVPVRSWEERELVEEAVRSAKHRESRATILYANVHVLNTAYKNASLRDELRTASTVYCDGSGVRLGAWLLGHELSTRLTGADWIEPLCARASREGVSLFLLGGADAVAAHAALTLIGRFPNLRIAGTHHGYSSQTTDAGLIETINRSAPGILLVGMGTPRQELWIGRWRSRLDVPVVWAVGALFDFIAGVERRGPRWLVNRHLEWAARLRANPRDRWRRYLMGNPRFVARVIRQRLLGLPTRLGQSTTDAER
jgi:N-acetylglucosaminyldiphosphoundecaprenol N-acetyl-beta-D-mannosaminyltransferase